MRRLCAIATLCLAASGCGDADDAGHSKTPMPMDQVPAAVLKAAKEAEPGLTFYAAYKDRFEGQDSIELKGRTKSGKIQEVEISPEGKLLGTE